MSMTHSRATDMSATDVGSADVTQIVTFRLGTDLFGAAISGVERVLRYVAPTPVPNVPDWIAGVIEYQRRVIPVVDLRARFDLDEHPVTGETRVLVFNVEGHWVAGVVDAVLDVAALGAAALAPPPPLFRGLAGEFVYGIARRDGRLVIVLDIDRLLSATERISLSQAIVEAEVEVAGIA